MKKILLLLLISAHCFGQGRIFESIGLPSVLPTGFGLSRDYLFNLSDSIAYKRIGTSWVKSSIRLFAKDGIQGIKGDAGASGGGSIFAGLVGNQIDLFARISSNQSVILTNDIGLTSPLMIQKDINNRSKKIVINLNGYALYDASVNGLRYLVGRIPTDQNEALNVMQSVAVIIRDGAIIGKNTGIGTGIDLAATYGSVFEAVDFRGWKDGLHLRFALMTAVRNCMTNGISNEAFIADMGNWPGANNNNSQSNSSRFEQCRVFCNDGSFSGFSAYAASGMIWEQDIVEGSNSQYGWYIDGKGATVVKDGYLHMSHNENSPTKSAVYVSMYDAYFRVSGYFTQYPSTIFNFNSTGGNSKFYLQDIPYVPIGSKFSCNAPLSIDNIEWPFQVDSTFFNIKPNSWSLTRWGDGADKFPVIKTIPQIKINGINY